MKRTYLALSLIAASLIAAPVAVQAQDKGGFKTKPEAKAEKKNDKKKPAAAKKGKDDKKTGFKMKGAEGKK